MDALTQAHADLLTRADRLATAHRAALSLLVDALLRMQETGDVVGAQAIVDGMQRMVTP